MSAWPQEETLPRSHDRGPSTLRHHSNSPASLARRIRLLRKHRWRFANSQFGLSDMICFFGARCYEVVKSGILGATHEKAF